MNSLHHQILTLFLCLHLILTGVATSEDIGKFSLIHNQPEGGADFSANLPREEGTSLDVVKIVKKSDEFLEGLFGDAQNFEFWSASLRGQTTQEGIVWIWEVGYIHPESKVKSRLFNPRLFFIRLQLDGNVLTSAKPPIKKAEQNVPAKSDRSGG